MPETSTPFPKGSRPEGKYSCMGMEFGLLAAVGYVTFFPDGVFWDQAFAYPPSEPNVGNWSMNVTGILVFSEGLDFSGGVYVKDANRATLHLREGKTRAHADGGSISCDYYGPEEPGA